MLFLVHLHVPYSTLRRLSPFGVFLVLFLRCCFVLRALVCWSYFWLKHFECTVVLVFRFRGCNRGGERVFGISVGFLVSVFICIVFLWVAFCCVISFKSIWELGFVYL